MTLRLAAPGPERRRDRARSACTTSSEMPLRSITAGRELVVAGGVLGEVARRSRASLSIAATSAPEWLAMMSTSPRWSMCWWVRTTSSMSSIEWPCSASWCWSSSSARPEFGPGVDERQRVVLDQVGVHAADRERRRDPQAVDALPRRRARAPLGGERLAHERISVSSSSVRASISSLRRRPRG